MAAAGERLARERGERPGDPALAAREVEAAAWEAVGLGLLGRPAPARNWRQLREQAWRAAQARPREAGGWRAVGLARLMEDRPDRAAKFLARAQGLGPSAEGELALALLAPAGTPARGAALARAREQNPDLAAARLLLARELAVAGRTAAAQEEYRAVLARDPENLAARLGRAGLLLGEATPAARQEAAAILAAVLGQDPGNAAARFNLALARLELGEPRAAEEELKRLLAANPQDAPALNLLGLALKAQERDQAAAAAFERAQAAAPEQPGPVYNLGALCATRLQDPECAIRSFHRFLALEPEGARADKARAWLLGQGMR